MQKTEFDLCDSNKQGHDTKLLGPLWSLWIRYIPRYIPRERERERETNRQTDRQTDSQTDRQTDRQTEKVAGTMSIE